MPVGKIVRLIDRDGRTARLDLPAAEGEPVVAVLDSGLAVHIPPALMTRHDSTTYSLAARFDDLPREEGPHAPEAAAPPLGPHEANNGEMTIPVVAEEVHVRKKRTTTGKVRLRKIVHHEEQTIDEPVLHERVSVERVAVDRWVSEAPSIRSEGATLIVPVVEEVLVVERRLRVREEVRLTWHQEEEYEPQTLVVRREEVQVERLPADEDDKAHAPAGGSDDAEPTPRA